jgi:hypothetical protein
MFQAPRKKNCLQIQNFFDFQAECANISLTEKGNIILAGALKPRS